MYGINIKKFNVFWNDVVVLEEVRMTSFPRIPILTDDDVANVIVDSLDMRDACQKAWNDNSNNPVQTFEQDEDHKFLAFMAVIPHSEIDYIEDVLQEYNTVTNYLISLETTPTAHLDNSGQHMHFLVDMSPKDYATFADRLFRKKYHLRGQAKKGLPRQYGKLREIHDLEKMGAYTVKDGNIRTNMSDQTIARWSALSFKKDDEIDFREKLYQYLDNIPPPQFVTNDSGGLSANVDDYKEPSFLRLTVILFYREDNKLKIPTPNAIKNYVTGYMMYHAPQNYSIQGIDSWIFNR